MAVAQNCGNCLHFDLELAKALGYSPWGVCKRISDDEDLSAPAFSVSLLTCERAFLVIENPECFGCCLHTPAEPNTRIVRYRKLSNEKTQEIMEALEKGLLSQAAIARKFGCSTAWVNTLNKRRFGGQS